MPPRLGGSLARSRKASPDQEKPRPTKSPRPTDPASHPFGLGGMENAKLSTASAASLTASLIVG